MKFSEAHYELVMFIRSLALFNKNGGKYDIDRHKDRLTTSLTELHIAVKINKSLKLSLMKKDPDMP